MRRQVNFFLFTCVMSICLVPRGHATTTCIKDFTTGTGNTYLSYCVTANGNILEIQTPFGVNVLDVNGEGYGICDQNAPMNYTDYAVSDTGNWSAPTTLSVTGSSIKIARATIDGHWTLTQIITKVSRTTSITVVMALTNNQTVADVAYLVRFADILIPTSYDEFWLGGLNSASAKTMQADPNYGFQLLNVSNPTLSYWQGFAQSVNTGPNACAFAFNEASDVLSPGPNNFWDAGLDGTLGSIEMAYVGTIGPGQTKTVTMSYRGL